MTHTEEEPRAVTGGRDDPPEPRRWSATGHLDAFWPLLLIVLAGTVFFVASVAHRSMDSVGAVTRTAVPLPRPTQRLVPALTIVQISSHASRAAALAQADRVNDRGFSARVLVSDDFRPLNAGYFVVYTGPYADTAAGRAEARRVQARLAGSLIREVRSRR